MPIDEVSCICNISPHNVDLIVKLFNWMPYKLHIVHIFLQFVMMKGKILREEPILVVIVAMKGGILGEGPTYS
jgi:hypothetical protein